MKIEHIALYVNNLEEARNFLRNILMQNQTMDIIIFRRISALIFFHLMMIHV